MGPPISFPYHSHTSRDSYGNGMGVVWVAGGPTFGGSLEFPLNIDTPLEFDGWFT